jgi:hypothetical protein
MFVEGDNRESGYAGLGIAGLVEDDRQKIASISMTGVAGGRNRPMMPSDQY